jgi:hypothetical protein
MISRVLSLPAIGSLYAFCQLIAQLTGDTQAP